MSILETEINPTQVKWEMSERDAGGREVGRQPLKFIYILEWAMKKNWDVIESRRVWWDWVLESSFAITV